MQYNSYKYNNIIYTISYNKWYGIGIFFLHVTYYLPIRESWFSL